MKLAKPLRMPGRVQRLLRSSRHVFRAGGLPAVLLAIGFLVVGVGPATTQPKLWAQLPEARAALADAWPEIVDQHFKTMVFRQYGSADAARARQDSILASQIEEFDRSCQLTVAQKKKLELAGRGDIKRFFERYGSLRHRHLTFDRRNPLELREQLDALASTLQAGLFHDHSLLRKSLKNTLTAVQFERYDSMVREDQQRRHSAAINGLVALLYLGTSSSDPKREQFTNVLASEIKTPRIAGLLDSYYFDLQLCRIADEKLKPLLNDFQWEYFKQIRGRAKPFELALWQAGYLSDDGDAEEKRDD